MDNTLVYSILGSLLATLLAAAAMKFARSVSTKIPDLKERRKVLFQVYAGRFFDFFLGYARPEFFAIYSVGVLLNLIGSLILHESQGLLFIDTTGTAIASILLGPWWGACVGLTSSVVGSVISGFDTGYHEFAYVNIFLAIVWGYSAIFFRKQLLSSDGAEAWSFRRSVLVLGIIGTIVSTASASYIYLAILTVDSNTPLTFHFMLFEFVVKEFGLVDGFLQKAAFVGTELVFNLPDKLLTAAFAILIIRFFVPITKAFDKHIATVNFIKLSVGSHLAFLSLYSLFVFLASNPRSAILFIIIPPSLAIASYACLVKFVPEDLGNYRRAAFYFMNRQFHSRLGKEPDYIRVALATIVGIGTYFAIVAYLGETFGIWKMGGQQLNIVTSFGSLVIVLFFLLLALPTIAFVQRELEIGQTGLARALISTSQSDFSESEAQSEQNLGGLKEHWAYPTSLLVLAGAIAGLVFTLGSLSGHAEGRRLSLSIAPFEVKNAVSLSYLGPALAFEVASRLAVVDSLVIMTNHSPFEGAGDDNHSTFNQMRADYRLYGSLSPVYHDKNQWEVILSLVRQQDKDTVRTFSYSVSGRDIVDLPINISFDVIAGLHVHLTQSDLLHINSLATPDADAYDSYLRGLNYWNRSDGEEDTKFAITQFQEAIREDSSFSIAHAMLSRAHLRMYWERYDNSLQRREKAYQSLSLALLHGPLVAESQTALAWYHYHGQLNYDKAIAALNNAVSIKPNDPEVISLIGFILRRRGHWEEALGNLIHAYRVAPNFPQLALEIGVTKLVMREYDDAAQYYQYSMTNYPDVDYIYSDYSWLRLLQYGDADSAMAPLLAAPSVLSVTQSHELANAWIRVYSASGEYSKAMAVLDSLRSEYISTQFHYVPVDLVRAQLHSYMQHMDSAQIAFERAVQYTKHKLQERPEDARLHSALGLAYAGLRDSSRAVYEGKLACGIMPVEREAWRGFHRRVDLAKIMLFVNDRQGARGLLNELLSTPGELSENLLAADPAWRTLGEFRP